MELYDYFCLQIILTNYKKLLLPFPPTFQALKFSRLLLCPHLIVRPLIRLIWSATEINYNFLDASQEAESSVSESNSSIVSHDAPYTTTKSNTNCQNVRNRRRKVLRHKERMKISYVKSKLELLSLEKRYMKTLIKKADLELQLLERQLSKNCWISINV